MRRGPNGKEKSSICLVIKYLFQYLHKREKERVTQATLILPFRSVWLLNLEMSMVSERRFVHEQYAWITYTPINDARGILHTI